MTESNDMALKRLLDQISGPVFRYGPSEPRLEQLKEMVGAEYRALRERSRITELENVARDVVNALDCAKVCWSTPMSDPEEARATAVVRGVLCRAAR